MTVEKGVVELSAAIEALRAELTAAVERGQSQQMQFRLDPIELTVEAAVTKEASGKIGWSVLGLGGKWEAEVSQTLTLRLSPVWQGLDGTLTTDFTISSITASGDTIGPHS
ncbi:trypco2 family protein [Streptomyces nigrescens]|uniref:trypco2 family protein n=1 Tax=Streptomyces nigrescens TaxID=1920 RepID=UPI0036CFF618